MIAVYLCDDEDAVRHQMKTALEWKIFVEDYDMKVVCAAATAQELLDAVEDNRRSVYFLDVDLKDGEWDGFTLGQELRRRDPHGTLIYITSYGDLAWKTFQYHLEAFDYIVKEEDQTGVSAARCLEAVHARLLDERRDPAEVFSLRSGDGVRHVPLDDILFFETVSKTHHVFMHTADSRVDFVGSLSELETKLGGRFVRVHRAYLVAVDKIEAVDRKRNIVRVGGRECLLSRAGRAKLKKRSGGGL
ncbi:MAG: response regulator transcription factor [Lachnospiraceae bacterium]|nr:response regulator transcription factor [Lachnospiraceae bacterium]